MPDDNHSVFSPVTFLMIGIPGTEQTQLWLSIPFCLMYVIALLGNSLLLLIILTERSLHEPMYLFLSMLAAADLLLSNTIMPKMLAVFWFRTGEINFAACLTQMFFIHVSFTSESGILLAMGLDRFVAICNPLRYTSLLSKPVIMQIGLVVLTQSVCFILPFIFLVKQQKFCNTKLTQTYCQYRTIAQLACDDLPSSRLYGITVAILAYALDVVLIAVSYMLILRAVFRLPSKGSRLKALRTCGSHICVILTFYPPSFFSPTAYQYRDVIPGYILNLLANSHVLLPPMLNPIIYGVTTKEILKSLINLFY